MRQFPPTPHQAVIPESHGDSVDVDNVSDINKEPESVFGAMDGFLGNGVTPDSKAKKTKKKLVERTFMDSKGYLGKYSLYLHNSKANFSHINTFQQNI